MSRNLNKILFYAIEKLVTTSSKSKCFLLIFFELKRYSRICLVYITIKVSVNFFNLSSFQVGMFTMIPVAFHVISKRIHVLCMQIFSLSHLLFIFKLPELKLHR